MMPWRRPGLVALAVGDQIAAIVDKEIRPFLEPVVVDAIGIGGEQVADAEPQRGLVHRLTPAGHPGRRVASFETRSLERSSG